MVLIFQLVEVTDVYWQEEGGAVSVRLALPQSSCSTLRREDC